MIKANNNTLKSEILSNVLIDFKKPNSLASIFGFEECVLEPNKWYSSTLPISIVRVEAVRLVCNLVSYSFNNGTEGNIIHEFYPTVPPGLDVYKRQVLSDMPEIDYYKFSENDQVIHPDDAKALSLIHI